MVLAAKWITQSKSPGRSPNSPAAKSPATVLTFFASHNSREPGAVYRAKPQTSLRGASPSARAPPTWPVSPVINIFLPVSIVVLHFLEPSPRYPQAFKRKS